MAGLRLLPVLSVLLAAGLLVTNLPFVPAPLHFYVCALPLAAAGAGYAMLQIFLKPRWGILLKRLLLAATFLTWAVVQVLPPSRLATLLGDAVVAAYVLDLYWMVEDQLASSKPESR